MGLALLSLLLLCPPARAQIGYGEKGIYPVYETSGQWAIFDKRPSATAPLKTGTRFLVIGSEGEDLFDVARASAAYGGACRKHRPARIRTALLKGPRRLVGRPLIAIRVGADYAVKDARARYAALKSEVTEATYSDLGAPLKAAAGDARAVTQIEFGAKVPVRGLQEPYVFVEETEIGGATKRCLRLADGRKLVGSCAEMPRVLMAETDLLQFVSYDPSGKGSPYLLAFTKETPKWGDERWGFILRADGPRLFLFDAMDPACRAGF